MEDALISPEGLMVLTGAGLIQATESKPIIQHITETVNKEDTTLVVGGKKGSITLSNIPYIDPNKGDNVYVMFVKDKEIVSEPYIATVTASSKSVTVDAIASTARAGGDYTVDTAFPEFDSVIVDYYVAHTDSSVKQVNITADSFGTNFYLEASTLFKNEDGIDCPAEFVIPNCKIQSNFSFSMAATGRLVA